MITLLILAAVTVADYGAVAREMCEKPASEGEVMVCQTYRAGMAEGAAIVGRALAADMRRAGRIEQAEELEASARRLVGER